MIAVDTSALMAILLDEPAAADCITVLASEEHLVISAGTVAEALIVAARRGVSEEMVRMVDGLGFEVAPEAPRARFARTRSGSTESSQIFVPAATIDSIGEGMARDLLGDGVDAGQHSGWKREC